MFAYIRIYRNVEVRFVQHTTRNHAQQAGTEGSRSKGQEPLHRYWIDNALKQRRLHLVPRIKASL